MLKAIKRLLRPDRTAMAVAEASHDPDLETTLSLRPTAARLTCEALIRLSRLLRGPTVRYSHIRFDFSSVEEFSGPWGAHFAILIRLAQDLGIPVSVCGLNEQPARLAWLFRHSDQVRALVCESSIRQGLVIQPRPVSRQQRS